MWSDVYNYNTTDDVFATSPSEDISFNGQNATLGITISSQTETSWTTILIYHTIVSLLIMVFIVAGNMLTIIVMLSNPKLLTNSNMIVTNMAFCDMGIGLSIPVRIYLRSPLYTCTSPVYHLLLKMTYIFPLLTSGWNLNLISVERYIAIAYPFRYQTSVTPTLVKKMLAGTWVLSGFLVGCYWLFLIGKPTLDPCPEYHAHVPFGDAISVIILLFVFTLLITLYGKIVMIARKQQRAIQSTMVGSNVNNVTVSEPKATRMVITLLSVCLFMGSPYMLRSAVGLSPTGKDNHVYLIFEYISLHFGFANSAVNFFIYSWHYPDFRKACKVLVFRSK